MSGIDFAVVSGRASITAGGREVLAFFALPGNDGHALESSHNFYCLDDEACAAIALAKYDAGPILATVSWGEWCKASLASEGAWRAVQNYVWERARSRARQALAGQGVG